MLPVSPKADGGETAVKEEKVATKPVAKVALAAAAEEQKTLRGTQSQDVSDWQGFVNAMNDSSVGTINLTGDITVANKGTDVNGLTRPNPVVNGGKIQLTGSNISGGLIIDGQGHSINFGANYLSFTTNNQKNSAAWDIDFKNLVINADGYDNSWSTYGGAFSPIYMGGDDISTSLLSQNKVTFENVTADVKNGAFFNTTMAQQTTDNPYTTVTFKGNNTITVEALNVAGNQLYNYSSAVSASHIIFADGSNTVFNVSSAKTNNDQNAGGNILRAKIEDSNDTDPAIDVQQGATVTLNGKSTDVKGMLVNSAIDGTVQVDGNLNANMADGHSIAIWAGNLNIGKTGVVNIDTKQSNDGATTNGVTNYNGYHFAPISLGVGFAANLQNADSNTLDNQGKLTIVRSGDNTSTSPLISFGSGASALQKGTFTLNVDDGATLDLQDSAQSSIAGATTNTPNIGLITMWGSGSASTSNNINITNPAYVNLQRTGNQTGTLIRLENLTNHVNIQSNGSNNPLPLAQWDEGNKTDAPSYYWYINNLTTQNNWGNNSISGFAGQGQSAGQNKNGEAKFLHSNGTVTMGGSQAGLNQYQYVDGTITQGQPNPGVTYQTPYLNGFLNNFNWWTPQRIAMGHSLEDVAKPTDSEKYQPEVKTIDGNTNQTLNDLNPKDGISGLLSSDGTVTTDLSPIQNVSWYNSTTDASEWTSNMNGVDAPTNPTGNLKTTDKSAWAKVTYTDGSIDFVNIPLNITQPMADTYNPSYKPVNVEQGQTATDDPSFTDQDGKNTTAPDGTTYTTGTNTPDWATINPSTGTVTVAPGTDVTPGAYNIPVTVTYPDKSTDDTTVPVIVTKDGQTVVWGDNGAVVLTTDASNTKAHETTENSQVVPVSDVNVTAEGYKLVNGKLETTATPITIDPSTVSWKTAPNTNVDQATAAGKKITGNEINVNLTNNADAQAILGSKNGTVTTNPFDIDAKGAGAKTNVTTPVNVKLGSDLTDDQFKALVDNNIPTDEIASTTWGTKPDAQGNGGVIKITFTDKDANGNPTYLNVDVPASSIKVTTDADDNNPQGQDVITKVGETPDAKGGISNTGDLPDGTTYTWKDTPDVETPGKKPATVVVTYPDGSKDEVPTNVIVDANPEIKPINTTVGGNPSATEGIANLNNGGTTPVDGYPSGATWTTAPDTSKPGLTSGTATVTYPDGTTQTVEIPVAVSNGQDVNVIDSQNNTYSVHGEDVITHKTSDGNIIGNPVIKSFSLSSWTRVNNQMVYTKPYIYTLNADGTAYELTQTGDKPAGMTVNAPQSIDASLIKISWVPAGEDLFNNGVGDIKGNGQPTSEATEANGGTKTITYTNSNNDQYGYPKYVVNVDSSSVNWPIFGYGPSTSHPFPSVYIYGAEANGTIPTVRTDATDVKTALGDASKVVNTSDLTAAHNSEVASVEWQTLPDTTKADAQAPATVRIHFTDGHYLDIPVKVNVVGVESGKNHPSDTDLNKDITRTITVNYPADYTGDKSQPAQQVVHFTRDKITDLSKPADQQVSYTDWQVDGTDTWAAYTAPTITGYTADKPTVEQVTVTSDMKDTSVTINYAKDTDTPVPYDPNNNEMNMDVTRTIHYDVPAGHAAIADQTQTVHYVRKDANGNAGYTDPVTGKTTWVAWTPENGNAEFPEKAVEQITGYDSYVNGTKATEAPAAAITTKDVDGYATPQNGQTVTVTYKSTSTTPSEDTTVTYVFHDDTDNKTVAGGTSVSGKPGTTQNVNLTIPEGYKLADGQTLPTSVTMPNADQTVTIHLVHATKTVTPGDPGVTPDNPDYKDLFHDVTRTIIVENPVTNQKDTTTQTVVFGRTGTYDEVDKKFTSFGDWKVYNTDTNTLTDSTTGTWAEFDAPVFPGYTANPEKVNAETVNADTPDTTVTITYTKNNDGGNNNGGGETPTNPTTPTTPTNPTPGDNGNGDNNGGNTDNNNNGNDDNNTNDNGNDNHHKNNSHKTHHNSGKKSYNTNSGVADTTNGNGDNTGVKAATTNGNGDDKKQLPQTGESNDNLGFFGLALASLAGLFGLAGSKKRRNDK